ncbi:MAG TPA: SDR family NAD(P)-dependent oxidoreductase [Desulfobacterales bacterium]|nr:SDR family NAD(P)-dependent oxidoreductase [Desulfobacterales bacterium]
MARRELPEQLQFMANRRAVQKTTDASMKGKVCVVAGSTSGVGLQAVRRIARAGAEIVMVCRDRAKAEPIRDDLVRTHGVRADIVIADFRDLASVRAAAGELLGRFPRIDVLVNSAGIHSTTLTTTAAGLETVFCVNHLAPFLLTHLLLERMKASAPSRIIQVNSEGHRFASVHLDDLGWQRHHYTGLKGYGASKTAQLLCVWELADRLRGTGVTINAMHPGDVRTSIGSNNGPVYRAFKRVFISPMLKDPAISGEALHYLAAAPEMAGVSGKFFHLTVEEKPAAHALDRELGRRVWDASLALTGLAPAPRA